MAKLSDAADLFGVLRSWNRCHGAFYQARESDLRWNLEHQALLSYRTDALAGVPVILGEATPEGVAAGILEKGIWVSLYGGVKDGCENDFAAAVEELARLCGKRRVAIGADEFHFLPGIPVDDPAGERLSEAFRARGFASKACVDYVGAPKGEMCQAYVREAGAEAARRGWALRLVESAHDRDELGKFLAKEFPGRWLREWDFHKSRDDTGRGFWNLLRDEAGKILGFSRLALRGRVPDPEKGWTPGAMRLAFSPGSGPKDTDSCLGPIGISATERGRGAGKLLLGLSIHELRLQGSELLCIDWTDAYNYYTPLAFPVARRYLSVWKEL